MSIDIFYKHTRFSNYVQKAHLNPLTFEITTDDGSQPPSFFDTSLVTTSKEDLYIPHRPNTPQVPMVASGQFSSCGEKAWKVSNVESYWGLILDLEPRNKEKPVYYEKEEIFDKLWMFRYLLYPTISYTPESPRWRVILPFTEPCSFYKYEKAFEKMSKVLPEMDYNYAKKLQGFDMPVYKKMVDYEPVFVNEGVLIDLKKFLVCGAPLPFEKTVDKLEDSGCVVRDGFIVDGRRKAIMHIAGSAFSRTDEDTDTIENFCVYIDNLICSPPRCSDPNVKGDPLEDLKSIVKFVVENSTPTDDILFSQKLIETAEKYEVEEKADDRELVILDNLTLPSEYQDILYKIGHDPNVNIFDISGTVQALTPKGLQPLSAPSLAVNLAHRYIFLKRGKNGTLVREPFLPASYASSFCNTVLDPSNFKKLRALRSKPYVTRSGRVICQAGYDKENEFYLTSSLDRVEPIFSHLKNDPRKRAQEIIKNFSEKYLTAFPWRTESDKSAFIALLLTPFVATYLEERTPFFILEGNTPGVGKTTLAHFLTLIIQNDESGAVNIKDDDEARKQITSTLIEGTPVSVVDNVRGSMSGVWEQVTTAMQYRDRLLGQSKQLVLNNFTTWVATGNNMNISGDMFRRVLIIKLESPDADPTKNETYKEFFSKAKSELKKNFQQNFWNFMYVCEKFIETQHKKQDIKWWGSFPAWNNFMESMLDWLDMVPLDEAKNNVEEKYTQKDDFKLIALHVKMYTEKNNTKMRAIDVFDYIDDFGDTQPFKNIDPDDLRDAYLNVLETLKLRRDITKRSVNKVLQSFENKVFTFEGTNYRLRKTKEGNSPCWKIVPLRQAQNS